MEIRTKTCKSGNVWKLVNECWKRTNAWGHRTNVIYNSYDYGDHKVRYYNRTWEPYAYQSCMLGAMQSIKEQELNLYINNYKYKNNIDRFKKGEKEKVIKEFESEEIAKDIEEVKEAIRNRDFEQLRD